MKRKSNTFVVVCKNFEGVKHLVYVENKNGNYDLHIFEYRNFQYVHVSYDLDNMTSDCFDFMVNLTMETKPNAIRTINAVEIDTLKAFYKTH